MVFGLLTLVLLLGIFLLVKKVQNENQKQNLPPGPWGLPLLGHLASLGLNPHLKLMKWKQKYGPIIHIRFGSFPAVVLGDSKLIKEAFNMNEFSGRPKLPLIDKTNTFKGVVFSEGSYHSEVRNFIIRKFKEFGVGRKNLEDQIHIGVSELMDFIRMKKGLPINSEDVPSAHIIRTIWSIMMTDELDSREIERINHPMNEAAEIGPVLSELANFIPWMEKTARILSLGRFSFFTAKAKSLEELYSFIAKFLQVKKINWRKGQTPSDIMDMFLEKVAETTDESSPFHASQDSATGFLFDAFSAGIHTVHTSLVWTLDFMARNPEVQSKLQEEIDDVVGISRLPSLSDQDQMPYADAVVHEVLRKSSVVPLAVPHKTLTDVRFQGYTIKKDTIVFANTYGIHHDPEIWGDPHNFRPERWFGDSGKKLKTDHFLPFSTGRRICPGDALAREQLFLYVTALFQQYSVSFHLGKVPKVKGLFGIALHPSKFTVVFSQRTMK